MTFVSAASSGGQNSAITVSSVDAGMGDNRRMFIVIAGHDGTEAELAVSSITYDTLSIGSGITLLESIASTEADAYQRMYVYSILDADLPTGGTGYDVDATMAGWNNGNNCTVLMYNDFPQTAPQDTDETSNAGGTPATTNVSPVAAVDSSIQIAAALIWNETGGWTSATSRSQSQYAPGAANLDVGDETVDTGSNTSTYTSDDYTALAVSIGLVFSPLSGGGALYEGTIDQSIMTKNTYVKIPDATVTPTENTLTVTISAEGSDPGDVVVADNIGISLTPP